ncbi:flavin reductase family protein [Celeribacter halophilus]|uniref:flavin reductase family protein n=1 Tax=Celeribacter halophilus TaxID=576117 RepID=UPI001C0888A0|nr:flavin reductase family protein [Celeribacter halophilus]MBU2889514.1 flavin reductase family protein [Celeribacter halophilus]MDO6512372.1 flavin reductase family protein [Celeribacter halophilus]
MNTLDPRALRSAFGAFMTGVTVVTSKDKSGSPLGFTANSFTSVSLEPPLVLVCLANSSSNFEAMVEGKGFAVNVLSEGQTDISNTFARQVEDRFAAVEWQEGPYGSPVFDGVSAWFDCSMHKVVEAGDHVILIGQVEAFDVAEHAGLGYARGAYFSPSAGTDALFSSPNLIVSALIEREGELLMLDDGHGGTALPEVTVRPEEGATGALKRLIDATGLTAEPSFVYSVFEDVERKRQHISVLCHATEGKPASGAFVPVGAAVLDDVSDPSILSMLERYIAESQIGTYGIYYGNQKSGAVKPLHSGS